MVCLETSSMALPFWLLIASCLEQLRWTSKLANLNPASRDFTFSRMLSSFWCTYQSSFVYERHVLYIAHQHAQNGSYEYVEWIHFCIWTVKFLIF